MELKLPGQKKRHEKKVSLNIRDANQLHIQSSSNIQLYTPILQQKALKQQYAMPASKNKQSMFKIKSEITQPIPQQIKFLDEMQQNNTTLRDEIEAEERQVTLNSSKLSNQLNELKESLNVYTKKIEEQDLLKKEQEKQIQLANIAIKFKKDSLNQAKGTELPHLLKEIKKQEIDLEQIRSKNNMSLAEISLLKDQIRTARRERVIFDQVFKKLETDLKKNDEFIKEQLYETIQQEKIRDQVQDELKKLKQIAYNEVDFFANEYENAFALQNQNSKSIISFNEEPETQTYQNQEQRPSKLLKKQQTEQTPLLQDNKEAYDSLQENLINKLLADFNLYQVTDFMQEYKSVSQKNEQLIGEAQEKGIELDKMLEEEQQLDEQIKVYLSKKAKTQAVSAPSKLIKQQENLILLEEKLLKANEDTQKEIEEFNHLKDNFPKLIETIKCSKQELQQIDENQIITSQNLLQYLSVIEKRAAQIIEMSKFIEDPNSMKQQKVTFGSQEEKTMHKEMKNEINNKAVANLLESLEKSEEMDQLKTEAQLSSEGKQKIQEFIRERRHYSKSKTKSIKWKAK